MTRDECATWELALGVLINAFGNYRSKECRFYWEWMWALFAERCEMDA